MTRLGCRLEEVPSVFGLDGLLFFIGGLPLDSALNRARYPEVSSFASHAKQSAMLADLYNNISYLRYEFALANSKKGHKPKQPMSYPTPWSSDTSQRVIGKGAIPMSQFDAWYYGEDDKEITE